MYNYSLEVSRIFKDAEAIMLELKHSYVGTEHMLLSILKNDEKLKNILNKYNLTYDLFLRELINIVPKDKTPSKVCIYTPLLKRVIKTAIEIAGVKPLNTSHLLSSLLEEGEGIAIRIMISMNLDLEKIYNEIKETDKNNNKTLEIYTIGKNLCEEKNNNILVGRDNEINLIIETLLRKNKNNPLLIGDAGVGKSAIIEELASRITKGNVPAKLKTKKIISLETSSLVAGTKYRGEFEEKLNKIIKEVENNPDIILFIDEIHTLSNAGGAEGAINASDILKPYLARGTIKLIGATTSEEYNKFIAKDKALSRRFELIKINEPSCEETIQILTKIKKIFEDHYNIKITNENIKQIVNLTDKYILNRHNPDKSIDLLDSVCAMKEVEGTKEKIILDLKNKINNIVEEKEKYVKKGNFQKALTLRKIEISLQQNLDNEEKIPINITKKDIKEVLYRKTNIKKTNINWANIEHILNKKIIGQNEQIKEIINNLKESDELVPVSLLLTGTTGVGKTKTVKEIANLLNMPLIRLDLSEYNETTAINRLIGSSAGYIGYDDATIFDKIKMNPYAIILLDELEKAHPSILNLFLQILDEGYITNAKGEKIDFKNTYIFMTSNAKLNKKIGFIKNKSNYETSFSKEFLSRITSIINYNDINEEMIKKYLRTKGIKDYSIINNFDYKLQGFRGLDKYLKKEKAII